MKLFTTTLAFIIAFVNFSFAGSETPSPVNFPKTLSNTLKEEKRLYEVESAKVCACQILRVSSKNENEILIAVFAQGTNNGDLSANFASAASVVEKEKKHLKGMFYDKITTAEQVTAPTKCSQLYKNIQGKYDHVKMYDVLDADALNNKNLSKK
jgi:hypothetical protein